MPVRDEDAADVLGARLRGGVSATAEVVRRVAAVTVDPHDEVANESGSMRVRAVDPDTGESVEQAITRDEIAAAFADRRSDMGGPGLEPGTSCL